MTLGKKQLPGAGTQTTYLYYLKAPASGANNIVISESSSTANYSGDNVSYTGADQNTQPDATGGNTAESSTSMATSVTTVKDNCWAVTVCAADGGTLSASTNITSRATTGARIAIGDSNGAITPAGAFSQTWTRDTSGRLTAAQMSIMPVQTGGGSALFAFL